jgi:hypothetical protein
VNCLDIPGVRKQGGPKNVFKELKGGSTVCTAWEDGSESVRRWGRQGQACLPWENWDLGMKKSGER